MKIEVAFEGIYFFSPTPILGRRRNIGYSMYKVLDLDLVFLMHTRELGTFRCDFIQGY
jgi:hypothetical protein